jgi:hypothetical protein|tara:strand:- start:70 stop:288 length:219 start_codon:yes stop_codon:yes gene_type:complete
MSTLTQKGKAVWKSLSLSTAQSRLGFEARRQISLPWISSANTCSMTASSKPMVAAKVGDIIKGRSGSSEDFI